MEPARTCVGCRNRDDRSALLRLVVRDGRVIPDPSASLDGRGAWVHPTLDCVEAAEKRRAWTRAFRASKALDASDVRAAVDGSTESSERTG
ncbi:YlxR family protein [Antiquaquibacter oligotrophicus]|uniref:YlxR family protein n=1 Tax=Antiquaquibacter oligotrophicus TaxID=2880260 RepID=UPI002AC8ED5A|nr:YlxR family protein [Antiquaquibacter oligotrophicus]UDF13670.1 YlxR family protein [Antiquaquibacter oligotrophicus]